MAIIWRLEPTDSAEEPRILYATYDVTGQLRAGANAVGLMLGEGWFKARAALLRLEIELPGGEKVLVFSDGTWKTAEGPIDSDSIYSGETYDARKEMPGWDLPGFDESGWKSVNLNDPPKAILSSQMMPPIRAVEEIVPLKMTNPRPGVFVFDMGQNLSGWIRLRVKGSAGTAVRMRHAELLYDDGTLNVENLRTAREIAKAFHEKFYDAEKRFYQPGTQTANTLPLFLRIAPEDIRGLCATA